MARNIETNVAKAKAYLAKHPRYDLTVGEMNQLNDMFMAEIKTEGFYQGLFDLIGNAFDFGFEAGRRAGKNDEQR